MVVDDTLQPSTSFVADMTLEEAEALVMSERQNNRVVNGQAVTDDSEAPYYTKFGNSKEKTLFIQDWRPQN